MDCTFDFITGIILFADKHPETDRQDIAQVILDAPDQNEYLDDLDENELVEYLESYLSPQPE